MSRTKRILRTTFEYRGMLCSPTEKRENITDKPFCSLFLFIYAFVLLLLCVYWLLHTVNIKLKVLEDIGLSKAMICAAFKE